MKKAILTALFVGLVLVPSALSKTLSVSQVKSILIKQSLAEYPGHCPCPYNTAKNGSSCGRRSAYIRPGGYSPLCYVSDVTAGMVSDYRHTH